MSDLLSTGVARLHSLLKTNASSTVSYRRGATAEDVLATIGSGQHQLYDGSVVFSADAADFIIEVSEFAATSFVKPRRGDQIVFMDVYYTVQPIDSEPEFRFATVHGTAYRIHAKKVR